MHVVHANWSGGALHLWAEQAGAQDGAPPAAEHGTPRRHPGAASSDQLRRALGAVLNGAASAGEPGELELVLPARGGRPAASAELARLIGEGEPEAPCELGRFTVPSLRIGPEGAPEALEAVEERGGAAGMPEEVELPEPAGPGLVLADSVLFFASAWRLVRHLLAQQRFVPALRQSMNGELAGLWQPWLADGPTVERLLKLASAMPPACRAAVGPLGHEAWGVLQDFLIRLTDAQCRRVLVRETMEEALAGRGPADPHVAWLSGLLGRAVEIPALPGSPSDLVRRVSAWLAGLEEERRAGAEWRLSLRLVEPVLPDVPGAQVPDESARWSLSFHLRSQQRPGLVVDAADIWLLPAGAASVDGQRIESPQDVLLAELGRAARLYARLEEALAQTRPTELSLSTPQAYDFLREIRPVLHEQGFDVQVPAWWDRPNIRLGARLRVTSPEEPGVPGPGGSAAPSATATMGLRSLVSYGWELAVGDTTITLEQFQRLAAQRSPLVRLDGRWIEVRPDDVRAAGEFLARNPGGEMEVGNLLRVAYASDPRQGGIPIIGMEATGWVSSLLGTGESTSQTLPMLDPPTGFIGSLRPYQLRGLSWLVFLDRFGLGACLADDMGLGKTIQLLALLAYEREHGAQPPGPTLLVVPMSVLGNWVHETARFTPTLRVLVHHGPERVQGEGLARAAAAHDIVLTTYALAHRDRDQLQAVPWQRVVLDEAQNIKNPGAKQSQAIRSIEAGRRVALTGTPVENRLAELWSILDFLNPGYLGTFGEFRTRYAVPIERYHDPVRSGQLRAMAQPFVLRRLKSDPTVIADLPEKLETKEYCYLTPEQARLYKTVVSDMLGAADQAEGIQRRGVVLAGLVKLKQVCNHPAQFLKEHEPGAAAPPAARSGKCTRLVEMLGEVLAAGDQALVFTQFRQMGDILAAIIRHETGRQPLFLHGGVPAAQRQKMVEAFQRADGAHPIFILSLKAGGLGLNLTAASHVFHFDRWWNPAVEAQATDRAYRIGQTRSVQVHKFVVSGTLEERIDQMIESKTELAEKVIGAGEQWLTELSTAQLRDLLALQAAAVGDEG
ncbi:MAG TPA: DEAD/DEAH box helicase [Phycisphaerales bacterium]|nr:DEAD/DEAH box helicase [Phycisphaerales bacterium]